MIKKELKQEIENGTFETFRGLLKKGIGTRSQVQFGEETGLSRVTINRFLNKEKIECPTEKTILTLAAHMNNVSTAELLESCGYDSLSVEGVAKVVKDTIEAVLTDNIGHIFSGNAPEECFKGRPITYIDDSRWSLTKTGEITGPGIPGEEYETWSLSWDYGDHCGKTYFAIGIVRTKKDEQVLVSVTTDMQKLTNYKYLPMPETIIKYADKETSCIITRGSFHNDTFADRFSDFLFGGERFGTYLMTDIGCGFYYRETPEKFTEFVMDNAEYFCTNKENQVLFKKLISGGETPDEIFKDYRGREEWESTGTGHVVADILTAKSGHSFYFFAKDEKRREEDEDDSCILCPNESNYYDDTLFDRDVLRHTYEAAKTLGIKEFGVTYHVSVIDKTAEQRYNVDTFYYKFISKEEQEQIVTDKETLEKLFKDASTVSDYYDSKKEYSKAGRIATMAEHALEHKNDTLPTKKMMEFIEEELKKISEGQEDS